MSTVSEVDIRDWEKIDLVQLRKDIEHARYEDVESLNIYPYEAYMRALNLIDELVIIRDKQIQQATKNICALCKKG